MILGSNGGPKGQVTIDCEKGGAYLILTKEEFDRFKKGEPITRRSGDCRGDFTITATLEYKFPPHHVLDHAEKVFKTNSFFEYTGKSGREYTIRQVAPGFGFEVTLKGDDVGNFTLKPDRLNDALHEIDKLDARLTTQDQEKETVTAATKRCEQELVDNGEASYLGHTINPTHGEKYTITGHDRYNTVRAAVLAIFRRQV